MRVLDLFSGIGGFSLGLERAGMETVAFCEYEEFPRRVLAKHWPDVPCYPDVRELTKEQLDSDGISPIDLVCGGYPCQPFSHAGKRAGEADDRHLWPEMYRLIETIRPRWVLAENVAGHITMGLDAVLSDLEAANYAWWTFVIPACAVDARHRRDRVWIVANANSCGLSEQEVLSKQPRRAEAISASEAGAPDIGETMVAYTAIERCGEAGADCKRSKERASGSGDVADSRSQRSASRLPKQEQRKERIAREPIDGRAGRAGEFGWWLPEPNVGRVAHGVSNRVDRLKALGNAVVPQVVEVIGRAVMETEYRRAA